MRIAGIESYTQAIPKSAGWGSEGTTLHPTSSRSCLTFQWCWHDVQRVAEEIIRWKPCTICTENVQGYLGINGILFSWHRLVNISNEASSCNLFTAFTYQHQLHQYWTIFAFSPENKNVMVSFLLMISVFWFPAEASLFRAVVIPLLKILI